MNSLSAFVAEFDKYNKKRNKLFTISLLGLFPMLAISFLVAMSIESMIIDAFGINSSLQNILIPFMAVTMFIIYASIMASISKKQKIKFMNVVYPGFSTMKNDFRFLQELKAKPRVGNIIDGRLFIEAASPKKKIFDSDYSDVYTGIECMVGDFKFQVMDARFSVDENKAGHQNKFKFDGMVVIITEPNQSYGDKLITLLDEYALRKQNGKLKLYKDNMFYTNTYKSDGKCILNLEGLFVLSGDKEKCYEGCLVINELVALLRTIGYDEVIV